MRAEKQEILMRNLRTYLVNIYSVLGVVAVYIFLLTVTGILFGFTNAENMGGIFKLLGAGIAGAKGAWWLTAIVGWFLAIWTTMYLIRTRTYPPIPVKEDEIGAIEITPEALCSLAKNELRATGIRGPYKAEFTRRFGNPVLQVYCDLTSGPDETGPVELGEALKGAIENHLISDFGLKGIKVAIIHQPSSKNSRSVSPQPAA